MTFDNLDESPDPYARFKDIGPDRHSLTGDHLDNRPVKPAQLGAKLIVFGLTEFNSPVRGGVDNAPTGFGISGVNSE
jgi:hypothetical protein